MFSNLPTTNFNFLVTLILSSANTLNWDKSEILSFGSELKDIFVWIQFSTSPVQNPKCITGAVYSTAYFPLSIFFYCAYDSDHFSFSTEIPSRIRPLFSIISIQNSVKQSYAELVVCKCLYLFNAQFRLITILRDRLAENIMRKGGIVGKVALPPQYPRVLTFTHNPYF